MSTKWIFFWFGDEISLSIFLCGDLASHGYPPFTSECVDDEDEVLLALAEQLGKFVEHVGGPEEAKCLLTPLEQLGTVEETVVRDKVRIRGTIYSSKSFSQIYSIQLAPMQSVESLCKVAEVLPEADFAEHFVPLIKRLATGDWFTARTSSCGLFAKAYARITGTTDNTQSTLHSAICLQSLCVDERVKTELRELFAKLTEDETPMVRRSAASAMKVCDSFKTKAIAWGSSWCLILACFMLQNFIPTVAKDNVKKEFVPIFQKLAKDDQDSVRLLIIESCVALAKMFDQDEKTNLVLPTVRACSVDKSWRVRYMMAEHFVEVGLLRPC